MKIPLLFRQGLPYNDLKWISYTFYSSGNNFVSPVGSRFVTNDSANKNSEVSVNKTSQKATISKAMRAHLANSLAHEVFITEKVAEYEIGKRHLANMMGENPETFSNEDIKNALAYLLPSGLYEPLARPTMRHPHEVFPQQKKALFDNEGRPFNTLFYTGKQNFYSFLHEISLKAQDLDNLTPKAEDEYLQKEKLNLDGSAWITKKKFEEIFLEKLRDENYNQIITSLERLMKHNMIYKEKDLIMKYRIQTVQDVVKRTIPPLMYTEGGVPYMKAEGIRKTSKAQVTVLGQGSGEVRVNGTDILYFEERQDREQIMFPMQVAGLLRKVDVEASVHGGGPSGQAGAMRYAISMALMSFVNKNMLDKMKIAGLLTMNSKKRERKKPGRRRARAKFAWVKR